MAEEGKARDWRNEGIRIVRGNNLDLNTPQTLGMTRAAAITHTATGAERLWAGTVTVEPDVKTGAHHHGELESIIYVLRGRARMRWGDRLEYSAEAGPGDFIFVPPYVPHQEINALPNETLECVWSVGGQEPIVVNLDIPAADDPETIDWRRATASTSNPELTTTWRPIGTRSELRSRAGARPALIPPSHGTRPRRP